MRERDLPPETLRKILATAEPAKREPEKKARKRGPKEFVQTSVAHFESESGKLIGLRIVIPTVVKSESNQRGDFARAKRTKSAKRILFQTMGPAHKYLTPFVSHFHADRPIRVTFTRLGGQYMDPDDNLRHAFKAVKDGVAAMLLADDADLRFQWRYEQETYGKIGIRIDLEML